MKFLSFGLLFLNWFISIQGKNGDSNPELLETSHKNWTNIGPNFFNESQVSIELQSKQIETISDSAFNNLPYVSYINLMNNNLIKRELSFTSLPPNLISLILNNAYKRNPEGSNDFIIDMEAPKLQILYLKNNSIEKLIVKNFPKRIYTLSLTDNLLTEVPDLKTAPHLGNLFLQKNKIEVLKEGDFKNMPNLQMLSLFNNKIKEIKPYTFSNLNSLETLTLNGNYLTRIDYSAFNLLTHLVDLDLAFNYITFFDGEIVERITDLSVLDLSNNHLEDIFLIKNQSQLLILKLNNNRIKTLSSNDFKAIANLESLNLSKNNISEILPGTFDGLINLKELFLNSNQLKNLPIDWTLPLKSIELLSLEDNQFDKFEDISLDLNSFSQEAKVSYSLENGWAYDCVKIDRNASMTCTSLNSTEI